MGRFLLEGVPPLFSLVERSLNWVNRGRYQVMRSRYLGAREDTFPWWMPLVGAALFGFVLGRLLSRRR
jgi:hypothetical protein